MVILGYLLIAIGTLWTLSRLLNQKIQLRNVRAGLAPVWRYILIELTVGFGFGILLIYLGYRIIT